jgi:hypothetical protein
MIGILIPMDVAVGEVIEETISDCNKMSEFLFPDYYVTNVKNLPTRKSQNTLKKLAEERNKTSDHAQHLLLRNFRSVLCAFGELA